jgi:AraC family transcriptional regulator of adaptative response / DNA-3-methyladenine glycosylase II
VEGNAIVSLAAPTLDADVCYRAVRSRDRRFEGRFVLAVTSTGIYCRPGCPARIPARRNARFLPSPAAAELAGFRPCRRCRPDASPDSAAWSGTAATITRALRLIDEGALDRGGVEALASRLGMGARHLRRLFLNRLGAPPKAVALTRRAHFARKLVEETDLPMTAVATAAGFGSVRRFNGAIRRTFRCAPREFRLATGAARGTEGLALRLPYHPPLDWDSLLEFLAARAIPGVEVVQRDRYRRTIRTDAGPGLLEVAPVPEGSALLLRVGAPPGPGLERIVRRVRRLFDLDADPVRIGRDLTRDPLLAPVVRAHPGLRVPGAWDGFETAVRAVLGQQVSVRGATTTAGRLVAAFGEPISSEEEGLTHLFPEPGTLARADLSRFGLPAARRGCLVALGRAVVSGSLALDGAASLDDAVARLQALPGVGPWTAHYVAMRALGEPDAFPAGDLALKRETGLGEVRLLKRAEAWRPWRAYATMYLWRRHADAAEGAKAGRRQRRFR